MRLRLQEVLKQEWGPWAPGPLPHELLGPSGLLGPGPVHHSLLMMAAATHTQLHDMVGKVTPRL